MADLETNTAPVASSIRVASVKVPPISTPNRYWGLRGSLSVRRARAASRYVDGLFVSDNWSLAEPGGLFGLDCPFIRVEGNAIDFLGLLQAHLTFPHVLQYLLRLTFLRRPVTAASACLVADRVAQLKLDGCL